MAQFETVIWDEDDEIVSDKLQQMADNETFCFNNTIYPYAVGDSLIGGAANLSTLKVQAGTTVVIWENPFASLSPEGDFYVPLPTPFPNGFLTVVLCNGDRSVQPENIYSVNTADGRLDHFLVHVLNSRGNNVVGDLGRINYLAIGW